MNNLKRAFPVKSAEYDVTSIAARHAYCYLSKTNLVKRIKKQMIRRFRRFNKQFVKHELLNKE